MPLGIKLIIKYKKLQKLTKELNTVRVLIIKLTSMGDLMHALPAINDAVKQFPEIEFDWVVDASFAEVCHWHPAVKHTIHTAHRRWKKQKWQSWQNGELKTFYRELNEGDYDLIIDLQGNIKSAVVAYLRRGAVHGYDKKSCRESIASMAYQYPHPVSRELHAVTRQRQLMASALQYPVPEDEPDYGVDLSHFPLPDINLPERFCVFVHIASHEKKMWPVEAWQSLAQKVTALDYPVLLPCGSDAEFERAKAIAAASSQAIALSKMSLNEVAAIIARATACVCSDTGLAHMAAVAGTPAITLYALTDIKLIGTEGKNQTHIVAKASDGVASMADISVETVYEKLREKL